MKCRRNFGFPSHKLQIGEFWIPNAQKRFDASREHSHAALVFVCLFWSCGILVPWPGINPCPLQWKCRVVTTGPPGKCPVMFCWIGSQDWPLSILCSSCFRWSFKKRQSDSCHSGVERVDLKNTHSIKVASYAFFRETFRTSGPGDSISSDPEKTLRRRKEEPGCYIEVLQQRADSLNIKTVLLIKEDQISQVKEFSAFLCMGRCKSLGLLKSFLWYVPQLSGARILCFSGFTFGSAVWWLLDGRYSFLPEFPQGSPAYLPWCLLLLMIVTSFAYWYGRKYSISQKPSQYAKFKYFTRPI